MSLHFSEFSTILYEFYKFTDLVKTFFTEGSLKTSRKPPRKIWAFAMWSLVAISRRGHPVRPNSGELGRRRRGQGGGGARGGWGLPLGGHGWGGGGLSRAARGEQGRRRWDGADGGAPAMRAAGLGLGSFSALRGIRFSACLGRRWAGAGGSTARWGGPAAMELSVLRGRRKEGREGRCAGLYSRWSSWGWAWHGRGARWRDRRGWAPLGAAGGDQWPEARHARGVRALGAHWGATSRADDAVVWLASWGGTTGHWVEGAAASDWAARGGAGDWAETRSWGEEKKARPRLGERGRCSRTPWVGSAPGAAQALGDRWPAAVGRARGAAEEGGVSEGPKCKNLKNFRGLGANRAFSPLSDLNFKNF